MRQFERFDTRMRGDLDQRGKCGIVGTLAAIGMGISAATGLVGSKMGSDAAKKSASTQADAAVEAAKINAASADKATALQERMYNENVTRMDPWLQAGTKSINTLSGQMAPGGDLYNRLNSTFTAPSASDVSSEAGYGFGLDQGTQQIERAAAARGSVLGAGTMKALARYGTDYSTTKYDDAYRRALSTHQQGINDALSLYNSEAGLSGIGQVTGQNLGQAGQNMANTSGQILMNSATNQGNAIQDAAAARASGYINSANSWGGMLNNFGNMAAGYGMMQSMMKPTSSTSNPYSFGLPTSGGLYNIAFQPQYNPNDLMKNSGSWFTA